jgi:hypothetical protein
LASTCRRPPCSGPGAHVRPHPRGPDHRGPACPPTPSRPPESTRHQAASATACMATATVTGSLSRRSPEEADAQPSGRPLAARPGPAASRPPAPPPLPTHTSPATDQSWESGRRAMQPCQVQLRHAAAPASVHTSGFHRRHLRGSAQARALSSASLDDGSGQPPPAAGLPHRPTTLPLPTDSDRQPCAACGARRRGAVA